VRARSAPNQRFSACQLAKSRYRREISGGGRACGRWRRRLCQFTPQQLVAQPLVLLLRALQRALLLACFVVLLNVIAVGET